MGSSELETIESTEAVAGDESDSVSIEEILWQYREIILDLDRRVGELEKRPQFAASLRTKKTGH